MRKRAPKLLDANTLWDFALKLLGRRALSSSELRRKLASKAAEAADIDPVIARLKEYGYLDDNRFAESFASARKENQGFGRMRVLRDLRQRRVAPAVADRAVTQAYAGTDETRLIEEFMERKFRGKNLGAWLKEEKRLAQAFRRLRYAGFSAGASIQVLKRYSARAEDLQDDSGDSEGGE